MKHVLRIMTFAACMAMIAGCSEVPSRDVEPTPTQRASVGAKTASKTRPAPQKTTRPWRISLEKADSCRILRAVPPKRFKSSQGKLNSSAAIHFPGNLGCARLSGRRNADPLWEDPGIILDVTAVVNEGADDFIARPGVEELIDRRLKVDGFQAFVVKSPPPGRQCNGLVDVADRQFVFIWLGQPYGSEDKTVVPQAKLCDTIPHVLSAVMEVLKAKDFRS